MMTLKIEAWQDRGIDTDYCVDKFEFCCWQDLHEWLHKFELHRCSKCKEKEEAKK